MLKSVNLAMIPKRWGEFKNSTGKQLEFSHINLIIGSNHAGKSRFARSLFAFQHEIYSFDLKVASFIEIKSRVEKIHQVITNAFLQTYNGTGYSIAPNTGHGVYSEQIISLLKEEFYSKNTIERIEQIIKGLEWLKNLHYQNGQASLSFTSHEKAQTTTSRVNHVFYQPLYKTVEELRELLNEVKKNEKDNVQMYYIPILRGLKPPPASLVADSKTRWTVYKTRTQEDYFPDFSFKDKVIITGLDFYDLIDDKVRGDTKDRKKLQEYETFLKDHFFEVPELNLIPKKKSDHISVKIGNDEHPIFNFGDGLQNLILCTYAAFFEEKPSVFVIEEADMFMHPGMQRKLVEVLGSKVFERHQFFITTHSNHMIDLVGSNSDVAIFKCKRNSLEENGPTIVTQLNLVDRESLEDLGVRNSSALIANSVIWVEGVSDRLYLQFFLKKYFETHTSHKLIEDIDYIILESQGANLTHLAFDPDKINIEFIAPRSFFILDGDTQFDKPEWENKFEEVGAKTYTLKCKDIECIIPDCEWKQFLSSIASLHQTSQMISYGTCFDQKNEKKKYVNLASYICDLAEKNSEGLHGSHISKDKKIFTRKADLARKIIQDWQGQLSPQIEELCEKVVEFITSKK